ncbi:dehydrogenase/reductase SDR family member on chromosome X-like isoform X2 [Durio zibethinus]|uniref:Dehydrogenase/reductase SDR family member on chromosome X-like isoform X2 n=1 Tax=Durio zibethinus TaxID=66656 RepID=A0A6P6A7F8_DURZI|nr:dehydrogenase/reductase SDR family member on chromosome X-like isoform X2 [Durio zibethinus]
MAIISNKEFKEALRFAASVQFWRMAVLWTISLLTSYFQLHSKRLFSRKAQSYPRCHPPISESLRPVCVITGATSGLGAAAAHALSREGFYVVLVGRSSRLLSKIMIEIKTQNEDAQVKAFEVDMSSFKSILEFKSSLQQWLLDCKMHFSVQLLINNAGILATSSRFTPEGYDQMMATNYIGAFCLTKFLLPLLKRSLVPSRIVNVTSFTHRSVFDIQVDKESVSGTRFLRSEQYPFARIYEYSKVYLLLFSYALHQQLRLMDKPCHVSVNAADPGCVKTNIMRELPSCLSKLAFQVLKLLGLLQLPKNGVSSILDAALAPPEASGVYFFGGEGRTVNSSMLSYNAKLAKELWTMSYNLFLEASLASKNTSSSTSDNLS